GILVRRIRQLAHEEGLEPASDPVLLGWYAAKRDEAAFAALVRRHGPMVWNLCRRHLSFQDAEDVFQATFLVLARKSATVQWRASVAPWLYAVARRLACKARAESARRPATTVLDPAVPDPLDDMTAHDLLAALDRELATLPEKYRGPVVLCRLDGRTQ